MFDLGKEACYCLLVMSGSVVGWKEIKTGAFLGQHQFNNNGCYLT